MPSDVRDPNHVRSGVPAARSGPWAIEKIVIPARDEPSPDPRPDCFHTRPGTYTVLRRNDTQFMTDLYDEWWTQRRAVEEAAARGGEILITGLGLGLVAEAIMHTAAEKIRRITIVELSGDVIQLVGPYLRARLGRKIEIVEGNAFSWEPPAGRRFTVAWHDIWPDPYTPSNAGETASLEAHYRSSCDWQGFWPREYLAACASK